MEEEDIEQREEWMMDELTGVRKPTIALLNKKKLSKYEMDELFVSN